MKSLGAPEGSKQYWYSAADAVDLWFVGVFEGGGAKGVAYSGALCAMQRENSWFAGTAGASAGAITAALVAAGLSPAEIEAKTQEALDHVQTRPFRGLLRLHNDTGFFPNRRLHSWLEDLLRKQARGVAPTVSHGENRLHRAWTRIRHFSDRHGSDPYSDSKVTFSELFSATGIELNVIAADLSLKRQVVFSHQDTPQCAVADAVVASCSIPFFFPSWLLQVPDPEGGNGKMHHHTIVDGGVWSNFPMFVFGDVAFRRFYGREPERIPSENILGFLLKEEDQHPRIHGNDVCFVERVSDDQFFAREWHVKPRAMDEHPPGLGSEIGGTLSKSVSRIGRYLTSFVQSPRASPINRGRWPQPRTTRVRILLGSINGAVGAMQARGAYYFLSVWLSLFVVFVVIAGVVFGSDLLLAHLLEAIARGAWVFMFLIPVALYVLFMVVIIAVLGVLASFVLLRTIRRILYGLVTTFVAGPGAPEWIAKKGNIIELPIPAKVHTLSFSMGTKERKLLVRRAFRKTLTKIRNLRRSFENHNGDAVE